MADQRTCYAGDLTSDAIGKTVVVTYGPPNRRTTLTEVLTAVMHRKVEAVVSTTMFFRGTSFATQSILGPSLDQGLTVGHTEQIEVRQ
ncbi:MAG: hypothetical protein JWP85_2107 [Rhodoglobus sp.]|nr:hypothetical protein [Rhodoglobus sp.]